MKYTNLINCSDLDSSDRTLEIIEEKIFKSSTYYPLILIGLYKQEEKVIVCINTKEKEDSYWEEAPLPSELFQEFLDLTSKHLKAS